MMSIDQVFSSTPSISDTMPPHKTDVLPLPYMQISETTTSNDTELRSVLQVCVGHESTADSFQDMIQDPSVLYQLVEAGAAFMSRWGNSD